MNIRKATIDDAGFVASLHIASIETGFLSSLGKAFLQPIYEAIIDHTGSILLIAESNGGIVGFIAGTETTRKLYIRVIVRCWHRIIPLLRVLFMRGAVIRYFVETTFYGFRKRTKEEHHIIEAELLSIAVDPAGRGMGTGKLLVKELEKYFIKRKIVRYKVATFSGDKSSNAFYRSCSFTLNRTFIHHQKVMNEYVRTIQ